MGFTISDSVLKGSSSSANIKIKGPSFRRRPQFKAWIWTESLRRKFVEVKEFKVLLPS